MTVAISSSNTKSVIAWITVWATLCALIHFSRLKLIESAPSANDELGRRPFLARPELVKMFSLGYDNLIADLYWLELLQLVGGTEALKPHRAERAFAYMDGIVRLDPKFTQVYWFAAFVLGGDEKQPEKASALIDSGIKANPDNWYLPFVAGVNQLLFAKNEHRAAKYYRMAAKFPGAPPWLLGQAQMLEANIPSIFKEINTYLRIYKHAQDERVRAMARDKAIPLLVHVYKVAPNEAARARARTELNNLGVDIEAIRHRYERQQLLKVNSKGAAGR